MKRFFTLFLVGILSLSVLLVGCQSNGSDTSSNGQATDDMVIETSYLNLRFPAKWKDKVVAEVGEDHVTFSCGDDKLFDVYFNSDDGNAIGTYTTDEGDVSVSVKSFEIPEDAENREELLEMQEDVNYLLTALSEDYKSSDNDATPTENTGVYEVETSLATLYYPVRWKDKASFTEKDDTITLTDGETKIFALTFGGKDGDLLGTYDGKELRLTLFEVDDSEHIAMQEDVNTVISYLKRDEKFKSANE